MAATARAAADVVADALHRHVLARAGQRAKLGKRQADRLFDEPAHAKAPALCIDRGVAA